MTRYERSVPDTVGLSEKSRNTSRTSIMVDFIHPTTLKADFRLFIGPPPVPHSQLTDSLQKFILPYSLCNHLNASIFQSEGTSLQTIVHKYCIQCPLFDSVSILAIEVPTYIVQYSFHNEKYKVNGLFSFLNKLPSAAFQNLPRFILFVDITLCRYFTRIT